MYTLNTFLKAGVLGPLRLGQDLTDVISTIGDARRTTCIKPPVLAILKYDDVELYFDACDRLAMIYIEPSGESSTFSAFEGAFDDWKLTAMMTVDEVKKSLTDMSIESSDCEIADIFSIITEAGVWLTFDDDGLLWSVSLLV
jgi:hypothetical protein